MKAPLHHHPGPPVGGEPPQALLDLIERLDEPLAVQTGLTTTSDGRWALHVVVRHDTEVPLRRVERSAKGQPVVYQAAAPGLPVARPAYPGLGE
jgi:hypothetical protein